MTPDLIGSLLSVDLLLAALAAIGGVSGTWYWVKAHTHPELVHRNEMTLLRQLIETQHAATIRELEQIHDALFD